MDSDVSLDGVYEQLGASTSRATGSSSAKVPLTTAEKALLLTLINEKKEVVEDKRTSYGPRTKKDKAWQKITDKFNSNSTVNQKTKAQIINWWNNSKKRAKKTVRLQCLRLFVI
jgi:hypothetical protein